VDDLFDLPKNPKPHRVELPQVVTPVHHYMVRWWLLDSGWQEFEEWMIVQHNTRSDVYEVWFKDIGKAVYFKLSFCL